MTRRRKADNRRIESVPFHDSVQPGETRITKLEEASGKVEKADMPCKMLLTLAQSR